MRSKIEYRRKKIIEWRAALGQVRYFRDFEHTTAFFELQEHLTDGEKSQLKKPFETYRTPIDLLQRAINRIERGWDLI